MTMSAEYWIAKFAIQTLLTIITVTICTMYSYFEFRNYYVKKILGEIIEKSTKWHNISVFGSVLCYSFSMVVVLFKYWTFMLPACSIIEQLAETSYYMGKFLMYIVFLMRLRISYSSSIYAYRKTTLWIFAIFFVWFMFAMLSFNIFFPLQFEPYSIQKLSFAANCNPDRKSTTRLIIGILFIFCDTIFAIGFMIAFVRPLKKLIALNKITNSENNLIAHVAYKATVLSSAASLSTTLVVIILFLNTNVASLLFPLDTLINVLSLVLMTKYFNKLIPFRFFCGWMIIILEHCCIDRIDDKLEATMSQAIIQRNERNIKPVVKKRKETIGSGSSMMSTNKISETEQSSVPKSTNTQSITDAIELTIKDVSKTKMTSNMSETGIEIVYEQ